jgi:hypothetical protein
MIVPEEMISPHQNLTQIKKIPMENLVIKKSWILLRKEENRMKKSNVKREKLQGRE